MISSSQMGLTGVCFVGAVVGVGLHSDAVLWCRCRLRPGNRGRSRTGSAWLPLLLTTVATARPEAAGTVFAQVSGHGRVSGTHRLRRLSSWLWHPCGTAKASDSKTTRHTRNCWSRGPAEFPAPTVAEKALACVNAHCRIWTIGEERCWGQATLVLSLC